MSGGRLFDPPRFKVGERVRRDGKLGTVYELGSGVSHVMVAWDERVDGYAREWVRFERLERVR